MFICMNKKMLRLTCSINLLTYFYQAEYPEGKAIASKTGSGER
jgi:hypothetical protein